MEQNEAQRHHQMNSNYVWGDRVNDLSVPHEVKIFINNKNMGKLENILKETSDPKSKFYGKHTMTKQEIEELTTDTEANDAINNYLNQFGVIILKHSSTYISAEAPLSVWESALNTQFLTVHKATEPGNVLHRCREYHLPAEVAAHVNTIMGTYQLPAEIHRGGPGPRILKG